MIDYYLAAHVGGAAYIQFEWQDALEAIALYGKMHFDDWETNKCLSMGFYTARLRKWQDGAA